MDPEITWDDLFEGEPDDFDLEPHTNSNTPIRNLEDELKDAESNAQLENNATNVATIESRQGSDDNVGMKTRSEDSAISWSTLTSSIHERPKFDLQFQQADILRFEKNSSVAESIFYTNRNPDHHVAGQVSGPASGVLSQNRFEELLDRINTPSELMLEQMDFQLHKVVEQIDSVNLRRLLHNIDPALSKRNLFRICRHAMNELTDSDEEDEHQEEDAQQFGNFDDTYEDIGFADSGSSKNSSRDTLKGDSVENLAGNSLCSSKMLSSQSAQRSSSSFLHSKPHLHDINPTEVEGHHPTIIARSPQRSKSRTSSLSSETHFEKNTLVGPALMAASVSYDLAVPALSYGQALTPSRVLPAPIFRFTNDTTPISRRNSPLRTPAASPAASIRAVAGSPVPDPASITKSDLSPSHITPEDELMRDLTPYASSASRLHSTGRRPSPLSTEHRPSDPFATGADEISFSNSTYSPPLSPLQAWASQIRQPKRQARSKMSAKGGGKEKGKQIARRAVSARSPSKARIDTGTIFCEKGSRSTTLGVRGNSVKINKNRRSSRKPSSKVLKPSGMQRDRVPSLPQDMDVDLPLPELRASFSAHEAAPQEAEGGKQLNESQRSPLNRKTLTTSKHSKAKPKQSTAVRKSSQSDHEQEGSSPVRPDAAAGSSLSGASPSPSRRRTSTRGIAVRKTRASTRQRVIDQALEDVDAMQISSPKVKPQSAMINETPTPARKTRRSTPPRDFLDDHVIPSPTTNVLDERIKIRFTIAKNHAPLIGSRKTSASSKVIGTAAVKEETVLDASPKTPARKAKPKPAIRKDDDVENGDADQDKSTPKSARKKGKGQLTASTPTRRSPRIARMKEEA